MNGYTYPCKLGREFSRGTTRFPSPRGNDTLLRTDNGVLPGRATHTHRVLNSDSSEAKCHRPVSSPLSATLAGTVNLCRKRV